MLNRRCVLDQNAKIPRRMQRLASSSIGRMSLLCPTGKLENEMTETDVRCRYAEEATLCWIKQNQDDPYALTEFMKKFEFDWADVREADAKEISNPDRERVRMEMIEDDLKGSGDALVAMKLVAHWLRHATDKYGNCAEEFLYLSFKLSSILVPKRNTGSLIENILNLGSWASMVGYSIGLTLLWLAMCYAFRGVMPFNLGFVILALLILVDTLSLVEIFLMTYLVQKRMDWLFEKPHKS